MAALSSSVFSRRYRGLDVHAPQFDQLRKDLIDAEGVELVQPLIEATEKYVTVTIHGCEKYMQLLNKSTSTDSPIRQSADSADIVSDRQKQILEAMEVGYEYKSDEIGVLVGLKPSRSRQLLSKQAAAFR